MGLAQNKLVRLRQRYERQKSRLLTLGPVLQGTITPRTILRVNPELPDQPKKFGPYYQWTWKREGKTVTVNLTAQQNKLYQRAINNNRKLEQLIGEMRALSNQILKLSTVSVKRRKTKP